MQDDQFNLNEIDIEELETRLEMTAMTAIASPQIVVTVSTPVGPPPPSPTPSPSPSPTPDPGPTPL